MGRATSKGDEVKVETPFRYSHSEIGTQVVVICVLPRKMISLKIFTGERNILNTQSALSFNQCKFTEKCATVASHQLPGGISRF